MKNELKKEISKLKKLKNTMQHNSEARKELHRNIKEMKLQLLEKQEVNKEKQIYIDQLIEIDPSFKTLNIDLNSHTVEELKKSIEIRKKKQEKKDA
jgi:hypothetical protein